MLKTVFSHFSLLGMLLMLIFISPIIALANPGMQNEKTIQKYMKDLENLSPEQRDVLYSTWLIGSKENLGYTLATIAWKESNFGKWMLNLSDGKYGSYGIFHINLEYAIKRNNIKTAWGRDRYADKLLADIEFSSKEALNILKYWQMIHKKEMKGKELLKNIFASYNGGFNYKSPQAIAYSKDASLRIIALQRHFQKYSLETKLNAKYEIVASN